MTKDKKKDKRSPNESADKRPSDLSQRRSDKDQSEDQKKLKEKLKKIKEMDPNVYPVF